MRIPPIILLLAVLAAGFTTAPAASAPVQPPGTWTGSCDVSFHGTSTLHDFDGTVRAVPLEVKVEPDKSGPVVSVAARVTVADMRTGDDGRDAKMRSMFQSSSFPQLEVKVEKAPVSQARPTAGGAAGTLPVKLIIAGNAAAVSGRVTDLKETADSVSFTLSFPVSLAACKLKPPSVAGLIRVGDEVTVKSWVSLKRKK
ncbi:MAG: hypothetical protein JWM59_812 [Verrucomicrobiales bacterium]|nr:hypothetical protein [Verrucomicrobiales bacterium]